MTVTEEEIWRQLFVLADKCQPLFAKHTLCIYAASQDKLNVAGTGILLTVADRRFLISAAHVMDHTFYKDVQFYAVASIQPSPLTPLRFIQRHSSARSKNLPTDDPDLRNDDLLDLSIAELQEETALQLSQRYRFLRLADLDPSPLRKGAGICIFGYPGALTQKLPEAGAEFETVPMCYVTTPLQADLVASEENKTILLYFPEEIYDATFGKSATPSPLGLSGCGAWRISQPPTLPIHTTTEDVRLVGIQHRLLQRSRWFVGTSVAHILELLWLSYPEFRGLVRFVED